MNLPEFDERRPDEPGPASRAAFGITVGAMVLGVTMMLGAVESRQEDGPPQPGVAAGVRDAAAHAAGTVPPLASAVPTWVSVPAIEVDAPVVRVGLDAEGWLETPPPGFAHLAGWYGGAPAPGARGTAVLVGHVDGPAGPAVFYELGSLLPGDAIEVIREDGAIVTFSVYEVAVFDKHRLPGRVYRDTNHAELRVITCGGGYQKDSGYQGNIVVFARLAGAR